MFASIYFFMILNYFYALMLKINLKNKKNIILILKNKYFEKQLLPQFQTPSIFKLLIKQNSKLIL
jgi:hypothetical protein